MKKVKIVDVPREKDELILEALYLRLKGNSIYSLAKRFNIDKGTLSKLLTLVKEADCAEETFPVENYYR